MTDNKILKVTSAPASTYDETVDLHVNKYVVHPDHCNEFKTAINKTQRIEMFNNITGGYLLPLDILLNKASDDKRAYLTFALHLRRYKNDTHSEIFKLISLACKRVNSMNPLWYDGILGFEMLRLQAAVNVNTEDSDKAVVFVGLSLDDTNTVEDIQKLSSYGINIVAGVSKLIQERTNVSVVTIEPLSFNPGD